MDWKLMVLFLVKSIILVLHLNSVSCSTSSDGVELKEPSIVIVTLIRNKAQTLPYFFTYLDNLKYPKDRISVWLRTDHNEDNTIYIIDKWIKTGGKQYNHIDFNFGYLPKRRENETSPTDWPDERFNDVIKMKEEGFAYARKSFADFVLFLDADVFMTNPDTLSYLVSLKLPIVSPMMLSDGLYSNFWAGMDDDFYYKRTVEYKEILEYNKIGEFIVPMVHTVMLIDLNIKPSNFLTFDKTTLNGHKFTHAYNGPIDDMIVFAISANYSGLPMYISNSLTFGYLMTPLDKDDHLEKDWLQMAYIKTMIINYDENGLLLSKDLEQFVDYPVKDKLTLSQIFMINLERRPDRRRKMELNFKELGLQVEHVAAVDGKNLTLELLEERGIKLLSNYADPFHKRPMTMGEVGCFLSHYNIWTRMIEENLQEVLVLEDDIKFEPYFKVRATNLIDDARVLGGWDLIYFGRKRLQESDEPFVDPNSYFVKAGYSYWTLAYLLTLEGAKKLVNENPLEKLIPVDEYLPIMFDQHPNPEWKNSFKNRNLVAYSLAPLIVYPILYTGEEGYVSDTEDSIVIDVIDFDTNQIADENAYKKGDKEKDQMSAIDKNTLINAINENIAVGGEAVKTEL